MLSPGVLSLAYVCTAGDGPAFDARFAFAAYGVVDSGAVTPIRKLSKGRRFLNSCSVDGIN